MTRLKALSDHERSELVRLTKMLERATAGGLDRALRMAHDFDALGHQSSTSDNAGRSSNGPSDPTGNAVMRLNTARTEHDRDGWRPQPVMYAPLLAAARHLIVAATTLERAIDKVTARSTADPDNVAKEVHCANPNCFEVIYTGTGDYPLLDRCLPCHRCKTETGIEASAAQIAERLRGRERRAKDEEHPGRVQPHLTRY